MAVKTDFTIDQGATVRLEIELTAADTGEALDLDGYTVAAQMRKHYTSSNSHVFNCDIVDDAYIVMTMTATQTANIAAGRYVYDLELRNTDTEVVSRIIEGVVTVTPNVTR